MNTESKPEMVNVPRSLIDEMAGILRREGYEADANELASYLIAATPAPASDGGELAKHADAMPEPQTSAAYNWMFHARALLRQAAAALGSEARTASISERGVTK